MAYDFTTRRLFIEDGLSDGAEIPLSADQTNYLLNVLRLDAGAEILAFNGRDGEWRARIEKTGKKKAKLVAGEKTREQTPPSDLAYLFAPLKQARLDYMAQKAVEMGAGRLQPVITQFTQVRHVKVERIRSNAVEAAEQCGVLTIAQVAEPLPLAEAVEALEDDRVLVFCDEQHRGDAVAPLTELRGRKLAVLVGPEGGFSEVERSALAGRKSTVTISLGPRILRADTAAVAALAVVQAAAGDWSA
ncbi:16S rRNA (uracil(1498)-N(3))-methyltransferase [Afifella sp. IM 167]|uniref:16S rRNA (uracil(1498)-N(3))-methyltransferase n=1 Tax=Afifella sp. IM 167 TaxID=2033586 RepID=UPI001CC9A5AE|nr:16S rRNA (uracil(1498)-N(3))-methyltransferase [Afifella sp. IM 167]MBZ8133518.1 16S rRNA (uracil(1498)-N(3))-methyltransferase [Afifella sp. IM 167]